MQELNASLPSSLMILNWEVLSTPWRDGESLQSDLDWKIINSIKVKGKCCVLHLCSAMPAMSTAWEASDQRAAQQKGTGAGRFRLDIRKSFFDCEGCETLEEAS